MKIRSGYVSNSSSSSFIVAFKKRIESYTVDELVNLLFNGVERVEFYSNDFIEIKDAVEEVLREAKLIDTNKDRFIPYSAEGGDGDGVFGHGDFYWNIQEKERVVMGTNHFYNMTSEEREVMYKDTLLKANSMAQEACRDFFEKNEGCFFYRFRFSDEDGAMGSFLEHGDTFKNLPHMIQNEH